MRRGAFLAFSVFLLIGGARGAQGAECPLCLIAPDGEGEDLESPAALRASPLSSPDGEGGNPESPPAFAFQSGEENHLALDGPPGKKREDSQEDRRIKLVLFNDNFGSRGNETGLTHGSRFVYSEGPADGESWSVFLESRLYIGKGDFLIKNGEEAVVRPVERNSAGFEKRLPISGSGYVILGASAGWTTNRSAHFMPGGSKDQQNLFHKVFHEWSDDIKDYEYDDQEEACLSLERLQNRLERHYDRLAELEEQKSMEACSGGEDEGASDGSGGPDPGCRGARLLSEAKKALKKRLKADRRRRDEELDQRAIERDAKSAFSIFFEDQLERAQKQCRQKTRGHLGVKIAFGKLRLLDGARNICPRPDLSCKAYLQMEGGLDIITVKDDSAAYFFAEINQPLFSVWRDSALSAFARYGVRRLISEGKPERNRTLGLSMIFRSSSLRLEVTQPKNSSGRLFNILNDDDSIVYLSYELSY